MKTLLTRSLLLLGLMTCASASLPPLASAIPPNPVQFNSAPYGGWQTGCHYPNPAVLNPAAGSPRDIAVIKLTAANHDCGATCANTFDCSHFVKTTDGPYGTCYLKAGSAPPATLGDPNYYVCGYVTRPKGCLGIRCPG